MADLLLTEFKQFKLAHVKKSASFFLTTIKKNEKA